MFTSVSLSRQSGLPNRDRTNGALQSFAPKQTPARLAPPFQSAADHLPDHAAASPPNPKAACKARTASSRYFSSITIEILISEVVII